MKKGNKPYYLGLDIGTDSVGYAAANEEYDLLKFHGEPIWGINTFEAGSLAKERREHRTARRRLDRKQQRVQLLTDIFATEIINIDPNFFIRRKESSLFQDDTRFGVKLFDGGLTDKAYHKQYPTIHHLICDLMKAEQPRDVRLVYLACSWLVANRGHFLLDVAVDKVRDFTVPYGKFTEYLRQDCGCSLPWDESIPATVIQEVMQTEVGVTRKKALFTERVYGGKKPSVKPDESFPFRRDIILTLLSGGKAAPKDLFDNEEYVDIESVSLGMDEDNFARILEELGDDAVLLRLMRGMYDCALLNVTLCGYSCISEAKVAVYNQHATDLKWLKRFMRKYHPNDYDKVFRSAVDGNYVAYSYNLKNCPEPGKMKKAGKEMFSDFLKKIVKDTEVTASDREKYEDMMARLEQLSFLPKQKNTDNRVIPQQLYRYELSEILKCAEEYLPLLKKIDQDGITNREKIMSIFDFRVPYFVGPLNTCSPNAWLKRKEGKIFPWNFEKMVDLDASEQNFIRRMTNTCTYLPGEDVLPYCSLLYSRFMVLNELNNLKLNGHNIPVEVKQNIYIELFEKTNRKVSKKAVEGFLKSRGYMNPTDELTGIDTMMNANLKPYHSFKQMLDNLTLSETQAEAIINHAAYSEDKNRMARWLSLNYPTLAEADYKYILHLNLKKFGNLSRKFLTGIMGCAANSDGEAMSIIEALWQTNDNLMQLLSERYTFREQIESFTQNYYADPNNKKTLSERLSDMYVSNTVKRQIIRALDVTTDVVKAMGCAPQKIFVEMARGGVQNQKGKRSVPRKQQILDLYKQTKNEDVPRLLQQLEDMGATADNRLQSDRLFLYYMQMGKCMYTGEPIDLSQLATKTYDIDHIYPRSKVKDDSILNNKVLVLSSANGKKSDRYPIDESVRMKMAGFWSYLKDHKLITGEKYNRLTRPTGFSEDELHQFINRQLVETRQSTKVVAQLLKERYPKAEIIYAKAGMVSEFRQKFEMLKCRSVNNLHHAKDAYLNIVVGNVYHEKFTKRWFDTSTKYNISVGKIFEEEQKPYGNLVWRGADDIAKVKKIMSKNAVHITRYAFCRKGGLFDQMPLKASEGLIPRKKGMPADKYGGYNKPTVSYYLLASYEIDGKKDIMFVPVDLQYTIQHEHEKSAFLSYVTSVICSLNGNKDVKNVVLLLNGRIIKAQAMISADGMRLLIGGKTGARLQMRPISPLILGAAQEMYIKRLDSFKEKSTFNKSLVLDSAHDGITAEGNLDLYCALRDKCENTVFAHCPGNIAETLKKGKDKFIALPLPEQVFCLLNIVSWFNDVGGGCDLSAIGGAGKSGVKRPAMKLSAWGKTYKDVRIIDSSAAGLFESRSENLLDLL